jgi:hypothetical protein
MSLYSKNLNDNQRITLNVGGFKHEVMLRTLLRIGNSRLGSLNRAANKDELLKICDDYNLEKLEFFFDRDPTLFNYILNYYRIGSLHLSDDVCPTMLKKELFYWKLENAKMELCCEEKLCAKQTELDKATLEYKKIENDVKQKIMEEIMVNSSKYRMLKNSIWNMVDNSFDKNSTFVAKVLWVRKGLYFSTHSKNFTTHFLIKMQKKKLYNTFLRIL